MKKAIKRMSNHTVLLEETIMGALRDTGAYLAISLTGLTAQIIERATLIHPLLGYTGVGAAYEGSRDIVRAITNDPNNPSLLIGGKLYALADNIGFNSIILAIVQQLGVDHWADTFVRQYLGNTLSNDMLANLVQALILSSAQFLKRILLLNSRQWPWMAYIATPVASISQQIGVSQQVW